MKQKDLALILVIAGISAIFSIFISKAIFSTNGSHQLQAQTVQPITSEFPKPDSRYFNSSSFDPSKPITINQNNNSTPFNGSTSPQ
jgi:hypothetical protein